MGNNEQGLMLVAAVPLMVCLQWTVIMLIDWLQERRAVQLRMLTFMAVTTLLYGGHYVYFTHIDALLPVANIIYRWCNLLVYPLYLLYIRQLTRGGLDARATWLWLLPALVGGGLFTVAFLSGNTEWTARADMLCRTLFALLVIGVCWQGLHLLQQFRQKVENFYADTEGRTLRPVTVLLILLTVVSAASIIANLIGRDSIPPTAWALAIPSLIFSTLLFCIGYTGQRRIFSYADMKEMEDWQLSEEEEEREENEKTEDEEVELKKEILNEEEPNEEEPNEEELLAETTDGKENVRSSQSKLEDMAQIIERLMKEEQLFLRQDLHIIEVARRLGTNDKYISRAINHVLGMSFAEYINNKRVAYAQNLIKKNPELPMSDVASRSGFKSMSSYYRHMRRVQ